MSQRGRSPEPPDEVSGDPWAAFGHLVAGVAIYGVAGWALDRWLRTGFLAPVGIVLGAAFGIYLTFCRYRKALSFPERSAAAVPSRSPGKPAAAAVPSVHHDTRGGDIPAGARRSVAPDAAAALSAGATDDAPREETA